MPFNDKEIVTDLNKKPVPQYFSESSDQYEVSRGYDGAPFFHEKGTVVIDMFYGDTSVTKTYTEAQGLFIRNDSPNDLTISINGLSMYLKEDEWIDEKFEPFTQLEITANGRFRATVRK
jgi:hypothetical protein